MSGSMVIPKSMGAPWALLALRMCNVEILRPQKAWPQDDNSSAQMPESSVEQNKYLPTTPYFQILLTRLAA
ncbi:MAG: hypothetical protein DMG48_10995 [Acidobacteria bacterium]|nr:MAG: hypothetical protein DMG48_10995 [Acidobacteriota bacterium]